MIKTLNTPIVVPEAIRRKAGLRRGDRVEFSVSGGAITISSKAPDQDGISGAEQRGLSRGLAQSEREIEAGLVSGPYETHEEFVRALRGKVQKKHQNKSTRRP